MFSLFMGSARLNALEDAYNTLVNIKKSKEVKVVKKAEFHELKTNEKTSREIKEGKEDKFMTLMSKNKNKKPLEKFHLTAVLKRTITYTNKKSGKINKYNEEDHSRVLKGHDTLTDSRVIEATSIEEAQKAFYSALKVEQEYEEYSSSAWVNLDDVQFIDDSVRESQIVSSDPTTMPLRQAGYIEYNFTEQETTYLTNENTCVIDNLVGVYGKELKLNKEKIIKLNKEFHNIIEVDDNEPEYIESDFGDMIINPKYNINNKLQNVEAKLKQYEEEYNKTQHNNYVDDIKQCKQKIFDAWKNKKYYDKDYIIYIPMIKPTFKECHYKLQYYIDEIEYLKQVKDHVKTFESTQNKLVYNIENAFTPAFIDIYRNICNDYDLLHEGAHIEMLLLNYGFKLLSIAKKTRFIFKLQTQMLIKKA